MRLRARRLWVGGISLLSGVQGGDWRFTVEGSLIEVYETRIGCEVSRHVEVVFVNGYLKVLWVLLLSAEAK